MNWFYAKDGHPAGPVDENELERLIATGAVTETTLVWHSGQAEWKPYREVRAAATPPPKPPALAEAAEQEPPAASETETLEPTLLPASVSGVATSLPYAGFWIRVAAGLFDLLILLPVFTLLYLGFIVAFPDFLDRYPAGASVRDAFEVIGLGIFAAYHALFVGRFGATPGKMICNLRVINSDGSRIPYGRALGRCFCYPLSSLFCGVGFILVALNRQHCALHDFLCDTRVIHTDS